jgi:light-regulated signal transduction histidine kinase (bacteriophytochrome)
MQEPLRVIGSYCDLLRRRYADKLDQDGREFIDYAVDGATRMRSLIDDLLIYSRVGREEIKTEPVSLSDALEASLRNLRGVIEENAATVSADELPTVRGNSVMLSQLFQNLIGNGIKFHGENAPEVHIGCTKQGSDWVVSVRDNGIGIAPEFAEQVFGMFRRLHGRSEYPGNGLGLALCKRIVERHDGRIWIEPVEGSGTSVCFTLPSGAVASKQPEMKDVTIGRSQAG